MSNVTLSIGGRSYTVACAEGEERHVLGLGAMIDGKLASMGEVVGQAETRTLLFASLLLADELHDAKKASPFAADNSPTSAALAPAMAIKLNELAARLENLAARLEN